MEIDDLFNDDIKEIEELEDKFGKYIAQQLEKFMRDKGIPKKTGALSSSIKISYSNGLLQIGFLLYGIFVNYGVAGFAGDRARDVDVELYQITPSGGSKFRFKHKETTLAQRYPNYGMGIASQKFLPDKEDIDNITQAFIQEYIKTI